MIQGVIFAYGAIELVGTAAGETEHPEKIMPKAINAVVFRICVFYVGSVLLLSCLLPYTAYKAGESPFVTFFGSIGITGGDTIMNLIVLTAALSSLNAGLYSTGRIMRSLSAAGSAPISFIPTRVVGELGALITGMPRGTVTSLVESLHGPMVAEKTDDAAVFGFGPEELMGARLAIMTALEPSANGTQRRGEPLHGAPTDPDWAGP